MRLTIAFLLASIASAQSFHRISIIPSGATLGAVRLREARANGSDYVAIVVPSALSATITATLPDAGADFTFAGLSIAQTFTATQTFRNVSLSNGYVVTNLGSKWAGNINPNTTNSYNLGNGTDYWLNVYSANVNTNTIGVNTASDITVGNDLLAGSTYNLGASAGNKWGLYATFGNFAGTIEPSAAATYHNGTSTADWLASYATSGYLKTGLYVHDGSYVNVRWSQVANTGTWYANDGSTGATISGNTKTIRAYDTVRADVAFNLNGTAGATVTLTSCASVNLTIVGGIITAASCTP